MNGNPIDRFGSNVGKKNEIDTNNEILTID